MDSPLLFFICNDVPAIFWYRQYHHWHRILLYHFGQHKHTSLQSSFFFVPFRCIYSIIDIHRFWNELWSERRYLKIAAAIIWVGTTFSQRYSKKMPEIVYSIVYNLVGIYLFYLGLAAGISAPSLTKNSLIVWF